ncbi:tRNA-dependent cyclodipeptide synthase [Nostoc sp. FACHB-133]|uniref:tRNA-dependent cyclodipeptide synthase n=1 Tax=Nostoc sp. FACHB-133 TaxID=2692835 RepID=UPI001688CF11|nr:tRNA-dependent cyclodipeptide synthase [Nostoc sp. FACHB-133]MBD2525812.1 tRNA-dependent cyclodipeptide synthase [Nostoc sp. FACHB-133]
MSIQQLQEFLNSHQIKYTNIHYSPAHTLRELTRYKHSLGTNLIENLLVEIDGTKTAMILAPASLRININSLQEVLGTNNIRVLNQQEFENLIPNCEFGTLPPYGELYDMEVFWLGELAQNPEVAFYAYSNADLLLMNYRDFKKLLNPRNQIVVLTRPKYKVEIEEVIPESAKQKLKNYEHCFLGVSLESEQFSTTRLLAMADWISKHFKKCTIFVGDSIHRITLQINQGLNEYQARNKALILGREYIYNAGYVFEGYAANYDYDVIFCSDIQKTEDYFKYHEQLHKAVKDDIKISNLFKLYAREFVLHHFESNTENFELYVEMSSRYLLEEIAIAACLVKYDLSIMIYPGSLGIFKEIALGHYPGIPDCLQNIIYVYLRLKGR